MKNCIIILFAFFLLVNVMINAQEVIATGGNYRETVDGSLAWTVGETVIETFSNVNNSLTQGMHQSKLIITAIYELEGSDLNISVFPNPVDEFLKINIEIEEYSMMKCVLYDIEGKLLKQIEVTGNETFIQIGSYKPATYLLKIFVNNIEIKDYKIIKH